MRGTVAGLPTPYPLAEMLPAFLQEDPFAVRLTEAFDAVLSPVISVLDCLDAYVDPRLTPEDFLPWLASWVGAADDDHGIDGQSIDGRGIDGQSIDGRGIDGRDADDRSREGVLVAASLHRLRGTVEGLRAHLRLATGADVEIEETGGTAWSLRPTDQDGAPPGLAIRLYVDDPAAVRLAALEQVIDAAKPAHLPHRIEVMSR